MTPKEKSEDLWLTFFELLPDGVYSQQSAKLQAKQCALIAVDEIIALNLQYSDIGYGGINSYEFWEQVKTEIENI